MQPDRKEPENMKTPWKALRDKQRTAMQGEIAQAIDHVRNAVGLAPSAELLDLVQWLEDATTRLDAAARFAGGNDWNETDVKVVA